MTRVLILSATVSGRSAQLLEHVAALSAAGAATIDVVTFRPVEPWGEGDPSLTVLAPAVTRKAGAAGKAMKLVRTATFTSDRWKMTRALRRNAHAVALVREADVIYADLPAAVPSGWWATRVNDHAVVTTSAIDAAAALTAR